MALWDRIGQRVRDGIASAGGGAEVGSLAARLGLPMLGDDGLGAELERRRRKRGASAGRRVAGSDEIDAVKSTALARRRETSVGRAYASLEIRPGASRAVIENAYRTLLRQFHPDRHAGDPERHASAVALAVSLTDAYTMLLDASRSR